MLQRILSFIGFYPHLPSLPSSAVVSPEVQGQSRISFTPGGKAAVSAADDEDERDERRERITDQDLAWPGKTDAFNFRNDNNVAYRFDLTLPGLDPAFYVRRPPIGGVWQPEGGVLLQPGEETAFETVFVQPPDTVKAKPKIFSYTITCYDPRRSNDPGDIVADLPMRWVPVPTGKDLQLTAKPDEVIIRPWRRAALFQLELQNKSYLPPSIQLRILRALKKEELGGQAEAVGNVGQALESRTSGVWYCMLPAAAKRGSYFATVAGTAKVADSVEFAVSLPEPVFVKYLPWLTVPKDWIFLVGSVLFLFWLIWGIPVYKQPILHLAVKLGNSSALPTNGQASNLKVSVTTKHDAQLDEPVQADLEDASALTYKAQLPGHWYGYHWPFGWNWWSSDPITYRVNVVTDAANQPIFAAYNLGGAKTANGSLDFVIPADKRPLFGDWRIDQPAMIQTSLGIGLKLHIGDIGAVRGAKEMRLTITSDGNPVMKDQVIPLQQNQIGDADSNVFISSTKRSVVTISASANGANWTTNSTLDPGPAHQINIQFPNVLVIGKPPTSAVAGQPLVIPVQGGDPKAKVLLNDKPAPPGSKVEPDKVTAKIPASASGSVAVATQSPGKAKSVLATVEVKSPSLSPEELSYRALLEHNEDKAIAQANLMNGTNPAKFALLAYATLRQAPSDATAAAPVIKQAQNYLDQADLFSANLKSGREKALAYGAKGYLADVNGNLPAAASSYKQALDADPTCVLVLVAYALNLGETPPNGQGHPEQAHDLIQNALQRHSVDDFALQNSYFKSIAAKYNVHP